IKEAWGSWQKMPRPTPISPPTALGDGLLFGGHRRPRYRSIAAAALLLAVGVGVSSRYWPTAKKNPDPGPAPPVIKDLPHPLAAEEVQSAIKKWADDPWDSAGFPTRTRLLILGDLDPTVRNLACRLQFVSGSTKPAHTITI